MTYKEQMDNNELPELDSKTSLNGDDPRMTAYLLNELDPSEKEEWEQFVKDNPAIQAEQDAMKETIERVRQSLQDEPLVPGSVAVSSNDTIDRTDTASSVEVKPQKGNSDIRGPVFRIVLALTAASLLIAISVSYSGNGIKFGQFGCNGSHHGTDIARRTSPFTQGSRIAQEPVSMQTDSDLANQVTESDTQSDKSETARQLPAAGIKQEASQVNVLQKDFARKTAPVTPQKTASAKKDQVTVHAKPAAAPIASPQKVSSVKVDARPKSQGKASAIVGKKIYESNVPTAPHKSNPMYSTGAPRTRPSMLGSAVADNAQMMVTPPGIAREKKEVVRSDRDWSIQTESRPRQITAGGEGYSAIKENEFVPTKDETFSTFSIDVDTASYSNVRRFLDLGQLPPAPAVKIEELVNYFKYDYASPKSDAKEPFTTQVEVEPCPWESSHLLARIAIKGKEIPKAKRPPLNLVFLIDVSGSMSSPNKLPLVKRAFEQLVNQLDERDQVAIVTYAGSSKVHLKTTKGNLSETILRSIDQLSASGSTAGADGIRTAYEIAKEQFDKDGVNRVILCSDGDFNVGTTNNKELENMIAQKAKSGIFLSVLGFGMGNYKDDRLATLSNRGNGNYGYIDDMAEARRLLVDGLTGTLVTIAKDVKIQIDFNPDRVAAWRLIGYEDRKLATEDFNNDRKDAGEIGAGHNVTALYEIVPVGVESPWLKRVDKSRYAKADSTADKANEPAKTPQVKPETAVRNDLASELMFVKLRYKKPQGDKSELITLPVVFDKDKKAEPTADFKFAASVALFGMLLRDSQFAGEGSYEMILSLAGNMSESPDTARSEYISLVKKAKRLAGQ